MIGPLDILAISSLLMASASESETLDEKFDRAARAIVYAQPCQIYGYPVDYRGIRILALEVQAEAVAQGMSVQDAGDKLRIAVELKSRRLSDESAAAHFMTRDAQQSRYERNWSRRCAEIAP